MTQANDTSTSGSNLFGTPGSGDRFAAVADPEGAVVRRDLLGACLMPRLRARYDLNDHSDVVGLRSLMRHTSSGRPHEMPLTAEWLVDFSRFFAIGSSVPQRARALGPHVVRALATRVGVGTDGSAGGLVLRDLVASSRGGLHSVRSLTSRIARAEPRLFEGCFAQDETTWKSALLGQRAAVFRARPPVWVAELVRYLRRHFRFPDGARLHRREAQPAAPSAFKGGKAMLDIQSVARQPLPRVDVADYIEMGRMVAQWVTEPATRPTSVAELRRQLDGIAVVPPSIQSFEFAQSTLDHLVLRLPPREVIEEGIERMTDPMADGRYPLPQFYADHYRPGFGPVMTPLDTLLARVGDQTIAQGR